MNDSLENRTEKHTCNLCHNLLPPGAVKILLKFWDREEIVSKPTKSCVGFLSEEIVSNNVYCEKCYVSLYHKYVESNFKKGIPMFNSDWDTPESMYFTCSECPEILVGKSTVLSQIDDDPLSFGSLCEKHWCFSCDNHVGECVCKKRGKRGRCVTCSEPLKIKEATDKNGYNNCDKCTDKTITEYTQAIEKWKIERTGEESYLDFLKEKNAGCQEEIVKNIKIYVKKFETKNPKL